MESLVSLVLERVIFASLGGPNPSRVLDVQTMYYSTEQVYFSER
jgi:hypothetical protein